MESCTILSYNTYWELSPFWKFKKTLSVLRLNHHEVCGGYRHMSRSGLPISAMVYQMTESYEMEKLFLLRSSHQKERETQGPPWVGRGAKSPLVTRFEEVTGQEGRVLLISISFKP